MYCPGGSPFKCTETLWGDIYYCKFTVSGLLKICFDWLMDWRKNCHCIIVTRLIPRLTVAS